jgi:hypothetical protein
VDGQQVNMKCTCGAVLPVNNRYSICDACLNSNEDGDYQDDYYDYEPDVDELTEHEDFERADEYYHQDDFGWDGGMEE